jgi:hypothetical protein
MTENMVEVNFLHSVQNDIDTIIPENFVPLQQPTTWQAGKQRNWDSEALFSLLLNPKKLFKIFHHIKFLRHMHVALNIDKKPIPQFVYNLQDKYFKLS